MAEVTIVQSGRWITIDSPLGQNVLVPTSFRGQEHLSRPFLFDVEVASSNSSIGPGDLLGKSVSVSVRRPGGDPRAFNGLVTAFSAGPMMRSGYRRYTLRLEPWLRLLDRTSDCRVFQNKSAKDILETLFSDAGFSAYEFKLQGTPSTREYCVQFEETDLAFASRLLEDEGLFYFFRHEAGAHTLVIADNAAAYAASADATANYRQNAQPQAEALHDWNPGWSFRTGKWTLRDYDLAKPSVDLTSTTSTLLDVTSFKSWERYEYPGGYTEAADGTTRARRRMEAEEAGYQLAAGAGTYPGFSAGHTFSLAEYPLAAEAGQSYALVSVDHEAADNTHFAQAGGTDRPYYVNRFTCIPSSVVFRPERLTPWPTMRGPQTAVVVGPQGDEIHCDSYGRIRVQFHWDRLGQKDDKSSCFVRVAQSLAGRNWGTLFTPRVGMEVVVDFLDGNPDRPLVIGAVYNAENMPPWTLPDNKNQSGFLSRSTTSGTAENANELRFVDTKGSELVLFHAEKDFTREVENDDKLSVDHDQTITVKNDRTVKVTEGNEVHTVEKGNQTVTVKTGNQTIDVQSGDQTITVGSGNRTLSVKAGKETVTVHGDLATTVETGNHATTVSQGNHTVMVSTGNHSTKANTGSIDLEATQGITLKCGENSIKIGPSGVTIEGMNVTVKGSVQVEIQGAMATLKGDGTVTIKGGMVMIN